MNYRVINLFLSIRMLLLATVIFFGAACFSPSQSEEIAIGDVQNPYYIGLGLGISFLKTETSSAALSTDHNNDTAYRIIAGYQFDEHWAAELFLSDVGKTGIKSQTTGNMVGFIEYRSFGAGALYQYPVDDTLQMFATAGLGLLQNNVQFVNVESTDDTFIYAGAGITWDMSETWELRAEYDFYKTDVQVLSINIVKHFGFGKSKRVRELEHTLQQKEQALSKASTVAVIKKQKTCENFIIDFEGVVFSVGKIELNDKARQRLDELVLNLMQLPEDIRFEIRAHTDDTGTEDYNYRLSLARGRVTRDYLSANGIALSRIEVHGYGEWIQKQGDSTNTARELSRRAELELIGVEKYVEDISSCYKTGSEG